MCTRIPAACLLSTFILFSAFPTRADEPQTSIEILATFDYPGSISTTATAINDRGAITGLYVDWLGVMRGFVRFRSGHFSPPLVAPNDNGYTDADGINNSGIICGSFSATVDDSHGFLFADGVFTQFDVEGPFSTFLRGINDRGDIVEDYFSYVQPLQAFLRSGEGSIMMALSPDAFRIFPVFATVSSRTCGRA
jgi:uncharacterized membrane protein